MKNPSLTLRARSNEDRNVLPKLKSAVWPTLASNGYNGASAADLVRVLSIIDPFCRAEWKAGAEEYASSNDGMRRFCKVCARGGRAGWARSDGALTDPTDDASSVSERAPPNEGRGEVGKALHAERSRLLRQCPAQQGRRGVWRAAA